MDRHDHGHPGALGHRVVRTVVHDDGLGVEQARQADLLPDEPRRSTLGSAGAHRGARGARPELSPPCPVGSPAPQREGDVVASLQRADQVDGVAARADGALGDRAHVERQRQHVRRLLGARAAGHSSALHKRTWARAADSHVRLPAARQARRGEVRTQGVVGGQPDEGLGDLVDLRRVHLERCPPGRGQRARHHRRAVAHGLHRRQPEALFERHIGEEPSPCVQRRQDTLTDAAGEDDALAVLELGAPSRRAHHHQGPRTGQPAPGGLVRLEQPGQVLAGFERAHRQQELTAHPEALEQGRGPVVVAPGQDVGSERDDRHRRRRRTGSREVLGHRVGRHHEVRGTAQRPAERGLVPASPPARVVVGTMPPRHVVDGDDLDTAWPRAQARRAGDGERHRVHDVEPGRGAHEATVPQPRQQRPGEP